MSDKFDLVAAQEALRDAKKYFADKEALGLFVFKYGDAALAEIARLESERDTYKRLWDQSVTRLSSIQSAMDGDYDEETK